MESIAVINGRIWDGERFLCGAVLAKDGKIVAIGEKRYDAEYVFDAAGAIITPGLVDSHVHFRGISSPAFGTSPDCGSFPFGVTAAADCGANFGDENLIKSFGVKCIAFANVYIDDGGGPELSSAEAVLKKYGDAAAGFKSVYEGEIPGGVKPLRKIVSRARELGYKVTVHTTGSTVPMADIVDALGKGDIITHVYHGGINTSEADGFECIREAKRRGVIVDAGMAGHVHTDFGIFRRAVEAGAKPDVISTDLTRLSTFVRGGRYGLTACMTVARAVGMEESEIFRAVTSSAAKALGKEKEWGRLETGRTADIAVIGSDGRGVDFTDAAGNRLYTEKGYECLLTVSNGEVVYAK